MKRLLIILFGLDKYLMEIMSEYKKIGQSVAIRKILVEIDNKKYKTFKQMWTKLQERLDEIED